MTLLLAQRAYRPGRIDPLKVGAHSAWEVGAQRLDKASELIIRGFSDILARFSECAVVCALVHLGEK